MPVLPSKGLLDKQKRNMMKTSNRKLKLKKTAVAATGSMLLGLMMMNSGCSRPEATSADTGENEASSPTVAEPAAAAIPAPDVPADAPVLGEVYPALTSGALKQARLTDLPDDRLLQAQGVSVTRGDLEAELSQMPSQAREEMRKNAFFVVEQIATMDLLTAKARQQLGDNLPPDQLLQRYFDEVTRDVSVSDAEVEAFYEENRDLVGNAPLEQVKASIQDHLKQQKQQQVVEAHVAALGDEMTIAMDADWVRQHAALAMDNPVDKARASGKPTFVSFGADSCMPCQQMKPFREDIARKYGERLNVVYVHVNKDQSLASRFGVRGIPHIIFFDAEGKQAFTRTGFMPQEQLEAQIQSLGVQL